MPVILCTRARQWPLSWVRRMLSTFFYSLTWYYIFSIYSTSQSIQWSSPRRPSTLNTSFMIIRISLSFCISLSPLSPQSSIIVMSGERRYKWPYYLLRSDKPFSNGPSPLLLPFICQMKSHRRMYQCEISYVIFIFAAYDANHITPKFNSLRNK
jgi:hypothetical protein